MYIVSIGTLEKLDSLELSNDFIKDHEAIKAMLNRCLIDLDYVGLCLESEKEYDAVSLIFKYHSLYHMGDNNEDVDTHMHHILQDSIMHYDYMHLDNYEKLDDYEHDKVVDAMRVLDNIADKYKLWNDLRNSQIYRLLYLLTYEYENRVD